MFLFRFALDSPDEVHTSFIEVKLKTIYIYYTLLRLQTTLQTVTDAMTAG